MKNWIRPVFILLLLSAAMACGKNSGDDIPDTSAGLLVFNMVPGDERFDVMLDTVTIGSNLGYGDNSGTYKQFRSQKYSLWVYLAGNHTAPVMGGEITLRNGKNLSAFLTADHNDTVRLMVTQDDITPSVFPSNARMRIVDLSDPYRTVGSNNNQQQLPLDFYLPYVDSSSVPVFRRVTYLAVTAPAEIVAGSRKLDINWADSSKKLQSYEFQVEAGKVISLIATGDPLGANFKMWQYVH